MIMDNRFLVARRRYDPDATRYINAVQLADGQALEPEIQAAVDAFVRGCKKDGIWSSLKASCIMCGARTIAGALVPLAGAAPTPYNFASGDYDRTTGLKGDGATKYLDSNRTTTDDGRDDFHQGVYISSATAIFGMYIGGQVSVANDMYVQPPDFFLRSRGASVTSGSSANTGFAGHSRQSGDSFATRANGTSGSHAIASLAPDTANIYVFARNNGVVNLPTDARLAFYSIGSAIPDLAALDNRVSTLVSAIAAAI